MSDNVISVIHVTPQIPPAICGVGDYATAVGRQMEDMRCGVRCGYIAAGHRAGPLLNPFPGRRSLVGAVGGTELWDAIVEAAAECEATSAAAISPRTDSRDGEPSPDHSLKRRGEMEVMLHYSGYGYDAGGAPWWIVEALRRRPAELARTRVVTFFHELYATARPWRRAFWMSGRQRAATIGVARASDAVMTNRAASARWLEAVSGCPAGSVPHLAISSTVGEPSELIPWDQRPRRAVTFGSAGSKRFALFTQADRVAELLVRVGIDELIDIGEETPVALNAFAKRGVRVHSRGRLPPAEVSTTLGLSRVGLFEYNLDYLDKSSVFAAMLAHGVACIQPVRRSDKPPPAGYLAMETLNEATGDDMRKAAESSTRLYRDRATLMHAKMLLKTLGLNFPEHEK